MARVPSISTKDRPDSLPDPAAIRSFVRYDSAPHPSSVDPGARCNEDGVERRGVNRWLIKKQERGIEKKNQKNNN